MIVQRRLSVPPFGVRTVCLYTFANEAQAASFGFEEARAIAGLPHSETQENEDERNGTGDRERARDPQSGR